MLQHVGPPGQPEPGEQTEMHASGSRPDAVRLSASSFESDRKATRKRFSSSWQMVRERCSMLLARTLWPCGDWLAG